MRIESSADQQHPDFVELWSANWPWVAVSVGVAVVGSAIVLGSLGWLHPYAWLGGATIVLVSMLIRGRFTGDSDRSPAPAPSAPFAILLSGLLLGRLLCSMRNPPADWDSIQYHLPLVAHWLQTASLDVPFRVPPAIGMFYPGNGELLQAAAYLLTHNDALVTAPCIMAFAVLALAVRETGIRLGASPAVSEITTLAFISSRAVMSLTLGTRVDVIFSAWLALACLSLIRFAANDDSKSLRTGLIALGLAAGTKGSGPALVALLVVAFGVFGLGLRSASKLWRAPGALLLAAVLGAFWLVRNAVLSGGNPLFPFEIQLAGLELPGLVEAEWIRGTTQVGVWLAGYAGHLRLEFVNAMYGVAVWPLLAGALALSIWSVANRAAPHRGLVLWLAFFSVVSFGLFLNSPYSGAYAPGQGSTPPGLNWDNLRYLLPTAVAALPLAAIGLTRFLPVPLVITGFATITLAQMFHFAGHVGPGLAVAAAAWVLWRLLRGRSPFARAACFGGATALGLLTVGLLLHRVESHRERISDFIWDGYSRRIPNLSAARLREIRDVSQGRPIAVVGLDAWWGFYGRHLSGRPIYVPVGVEAADSPAAAFRGDRRDHPDRSLWTRNVQALSPAFIVVGPFSDTAQVSRAARDERGVPIENQWCMQDTVRFRLKYRDGDVRAYEVRAR
jgi:hypothetical protein